MPALLFVCHANIARSASAELLTNRLIGSSSTWSVASAGVDALIGHPVDNELAAALHRRGIDTSQHAGRQADAALLSTADLVLAFEANQRRRVLRESPAHGRSTLTIRRAAHLLERMPRRSEPLSYLALDNAPYSDDDDFADPYGKGPEIAERAIVEIEQLLEVILPAIGAIPRATVQPDPESADTSEPGFTT